MLDPTLTPIAKTLRRVHAHLGALAAAARRAEATLRDADIYAGLYGVDTAIERAWGEACRDAEERAIAELEAEVSPPGMKVDLPRPRVTPPRFEASATAPADQHFLDQLSVELRSIRARTADQAEALAWEQLGRRVSSFWRLWDKGRHAPGWRKLGSRHCIGSGAVTKDTSAVRRHLQDMALLLHREGHHAEPAGVANAAIAALESGGWRTDTKLRASLAGHVEVRLYEARTDWVLSDAAFAAVNLLMAERESRNEAA
jgi:hypothetical protein